MAILRDRAFPLNDYPSGSRQFGPFNVPDSAKSLYFEVARCMSLAPTIWPNVATKLQIEFEGSTDGVNWTPAGGFGAVGGIHVLRDGVTELALSTMIVPLPSLTGRQLRINVAIIDGPLRTEGFIELRD